MSKNQFTGTATQLQRNRNFCQFNNDQYCNDLSFFKIVPPGKGPVMARHNVTEKKG